MSSNICEDQHKFQLQPSHQLISLKKSLRDIDIPPRKLLTRRAAAAAAHDVSTDMFSDESLLHKYLPHNKLADSDDSDDSDDPYSSDHFRMYEFKVRRCTRSRSHDWTDCPFAHPGEKARRRDPRRYHYSGTVCPEYRRDGGCRRGDACEFSHGVFECWLHPARYRTEACKDGKSCKRKVCFFAHTPRQLRILPLNLNPHHVPSNDVVSCCNKGKFFHNKMNHSSNKGSNSNSNSNSNHCCLFCHCCSSSSNSTFSPTSTLFGMSHFSPPMSPSSPAANSSHHHHRGLSNIKNVSYKDVLTEIMGSFEGLNFGEASSSTLSATTCSSNAHNNNNNNNNNYCMHWLDTACCEDHHQFQNNQFIVSRNSNSSFGCEDHGKKQQNNFGILSPTIGSPSFSNGGFSGGKLFRDDEGKKAGDDVGIASCLAPDLGWVNELLM